MKKIFKLLAAIAAPALLLASCAEVEYPEKSGECTINSITLKVRVPQLDESIVYMDVPGQIDQENLTVHFVVPYNPSAVIDEPADITKVFLVASLPVSAVLTPGLGGLIDMSSPLDVTVTAANGDSRKYTLTAEVRKSSAKEITSFKFTAGDETFEGLMKEEEGRSYVYFMAGETSFEMLKTTPAVPELTVSPRAEILTDISQPMDFSVDQTITVKAQDGSTKDWTVHRLEPAPLDYGFGYTKKMWMKNSDELGVTADLNLRGMTVTKNYVVISDRTLAHKLYSKEDGSYVGTATPPSEAGQQCMYVGKDAEGNLVTVTASVWTGQELRVFYWPNGETQEPVKLAVAAGCGDAARKFQVVGSLKSGVAYIYATRAKSTTVYRMKFVDGVYQESEFKTIVLPAPDETAATYTYMPAITAIDATDDSDFIIVDQMSFEGEAAGYVTLFDKDGNAKLSMADGVRAGNGGISADGKVFTFNGAKYFMWNCMFGNVNAHIRIVDITDISKFNTPSTAEDFASFFVFQSETVTSSSNGNGTGACDFDLAEDGSVCDVYIWLTSGDMLKTRLTKISL